MAGATVQHSVTIAADHPAFAGHFPGTPILPGVVLLDAALEAIRGSGALSADRGFRIGSAKFFQPVGPGATLLIRHQTLAGGAVQFEITSGSVRVATGTVTVTGREDR